MILNIYRILPYQSNFAYNHYDPLRRNRYSLFYLNSLTTIQIRYTQSTAFAQNLQKIFSNKPNLLANKPFGLQPHRTNLISNNQNLLANRPNLIHGNVGFVLNKSLHQGGLLNDSWSPHYPIINDPAAKVSSYRLDDYIVDLTKHNNNKMDCENFRIYQELNLLLNFEKLNDENIPNLLGITPFELRYKDNILLATQSTPDLLVHLKNLKDPVRLTYTEIDYKRINKQIPNSPKFSHNQEGNIVAVDLKNYKNQGSGINHIVPYETKDEYLDLLRRFRTHYNNNKNINQQALKEFIDKIKDECTTPHDTHILWVNYSPSFYPIHPPLWIKNNFNIDYLKPDAKEIYDDGEKLCQALSDYFDKMGIPETRKITPEIIELIKSLEMVDIITNIT